jgi:hypothetical protein
MEHRNKFTRCIFEQTIPKNSFIFHIYLIFLFYKDTLPYVITDILNFLCVCHQILILKVQNN